MSTLGSGSVLADRFRLESLLGQGGMGSVWRAQHLTLRSPVAIKLMDPSIASNPMALERFMREAQAAAALRSPHVVQTLDYGVHEGVPYIAMEMMQGESLADRLKRVGRLSPQDTATLVTQISRAVGRAHDAGIIHRDLKPDNVFLVDNEDEEIAKVLDFGIAKLTSNSMSQTRTGAILGTPFYMSPEQAEGTRALDHRSDVWALGVIAYECVLGARPFTGESIGELVLRICTRPVPIPSAHGAVPPGFDEWFARACHRDVNQRFGSVRELADGLKMLVSGAALERSSALPQAVSSPTMGTTTGALVTPRVKPDKRGAGLGLGLVLGLGTLVLGGAALGLYLLVGAGVEPAAASAELASPSPSEVAVATAGEPNRAEPPALAEVQVVEGAAVASAPLEPVASADPKKASEPGSQPKRQPKPQLAARVPMPQPTPKAAIAEPPAPPKPAPPPAKPPPKPKKAGAKDDETDFGF